MSAQLDLSPQGHFSWMGHAWAPPFGPRRDDRQSRLLWTRPRGTFHYGCLRAATGEMFEAMRIPDESDPRTKPDNERGTT